MTAPLNTEENAIPNCCKADFTLIKAPLPSLPTAAVINVFGGIILPEPSTKKDDVTSKPTNTET